VFTTLPLQCSVGETPLLTAPVLPVFLQQFYSIDFRALLSKRK
jgi:hypothetical protein